MRSLRQYWGEEEEEEEGEEEGDGEEEEDGEADVWSFSRGQVDRWKSDEGFQRRDTQEGVEAVGTGRLEMEGEAGRIDRAGGARHRCAVEWFHDEYGCWSVCQVGGEQPDVS